MMEIMLVLIWFVLVCLLVCKDMSGKEELRRIRRELEKMNERKVGER